VPGDRAGRADQCPINAHSYRPGSIRNGNAECDAYVYPGNADQNDDGVRHELRDRAAFTHCFTYHNGIFDGNANEHGDADLHGNRNVHPITDANKHGDFDGNANSDFDGNANRHQYGDQHLHADHYANANGHTCSGCSGHSIGI
jgi:hypothetical protein